MSKLTIFALASLATIAFSTAASAACPTFHTLSNGSPADASQVMDNYNYILQCPTFSGPITIPTASGGDNWVRSASNNAILANDGAGTNYLNVPSTGQLYIVSGGDITSPRLMTILPNGNIGIGQTSPGVPLHIVRTYGGSQLYLDNTAAASTTNLLSVTQYATDYAAARIMTKGIGLEISTPSGTTIPTTNPLLAVDSPGNFTGTLFKVQGNGNVGIGNTSPGQKLDVAGTIRQSGCTTAGTLSTNASGDIICTSDARLKNVLGEYAGGLNAIVQIVPKRFTYKPTASNPVETFVHAGFIAQEVRTTIPQAVALQRNGYYSLDTTAILAASVNAIKELKASNDRQAAELARLRAQNAAILAQNSAMVGRLKQQAEEMRSASSRLTALEERVRIRSASNM